jgi:PAS domain S-box-containing protein
MSIHSLRVKIPAILSILLIFAATWAYWAIRSEIERQTEIASLQELKSFLNHIHSSLENNIRQGNQSRVIEEISSLSDDPYVLDAVLIDSNNVIVSSTHLSDLGSKIREENSARWTENVIELESFLQASKPTRSFIGVAGASKDLVCAYPVNFGADQFRVRPDKRGALLVRYDLNRRIERAAATTNRQAITMGALFLFVTGVLGFYLHWAIVRRIRQLTASSERAAEGDFSSHVSMPGRDELAQLGRSFNTMLDQRAAVEESLRESESRTRAIVELAAEAIITINDHGAIQAFNQAAELTFGYSAEEAIGANIRMLMPEPHGGNHDDYLKNYRDTGVKKRIGIPQQLDGRRKNGEVFPLIASISESDANGEPLFTGIMLDITERVRAEKKLAEYRDDLERLVKERTKELEEAQRELLASAHLSTLGQLTATVSHELRNPLGTIRGSFYTINELVKDSGIDIKRPLERVERNITRCTNIIEELLDYTRTTQVQLSTTKIDDFLQETVADLCYSTAHAVTLELDCGESVLIDRERFRRCLINVLNNAWDAVSEREEVPIPDHSVTLSTSKKNSRCTISVTDTGRGISSEVLEKIFEPLFSTKSFGVGLGLPIVQQIMEQHGGGIDIESEVGRCTRVALWLPLGKMKYQGETNGARIVAE